MADENPPPPPPLQGNRCVVSSSFNLSEKQKLCGNENYSSWKFLMNGALVSEGLWRMVTGDEENEDKNDRAFYEIVFNVSESLFNKSNAKEIWQLFAKNFLNTNSVRGLSVLV